MQSRIDFTRFQVEGKICHISYLKRRFFFVFLYTCIYVCTDICELQQSFLCLAVKTCAAPAVAYANKSPNTATIDYNTTVTYTCITGYNHSAGDLTRDCQLNKTLTGDAPTCTSMLYICIIVILQMREEEKIAETISQVTFNCD